MALTKVVARARYIGPDRVMFKIGEEYDVIAVGKSLMNVYSPYFEDWGTFGPSDFEIVEYYDEPIEKDLVMTDYSSQED